MLWVYYYQHKIMNDIIILIFIIFVIIIICIKIISSI